METRNEKSNIVQTLPVLPLRGITAFPDTVLNFDVERPLSVAALNSAMSADQMIFLVSQKDISTAVPTEEDLYSIGTVCRIRQILRIPGGGMVKVMVEGQYRARIIVLNETTPSYSAVVESIPAKPCPVSTPGLEALLRRCLALFEEYAGASGAVTPEMFLTAADCSDLGQTADFVAQNVGLKHTEKQLLLEELRPRQRMAMLNRMLRREITVLTLEKDLDDATKEEMDRAQRDYYLREQMKVIRSELGEGEETGPEEFSEYREKIQALHLDEAVEEKLLKEVTRLSKQPFGSSESSVIRSYLDTCLELPWNVRTKDDIEISRAKKCLDEDHYGLDKVKERILEFLAVRQISPETKSSVLCLVGPPGVGTTSIAISVARAMGRSLARISLGGVHDEAEIRGHRKTYVGAMPGRIVSGLMQAKSMNPVMVLDEIDKLGSDYRGDPSSALLEVFDAEQNYAFRDNFLEIPLDLSDVLFITTANTMDTIPRALLDRMEVIELGSYTDEEKLRIAKAHLLPKQRKKHGLKATALRVSDDAIREIISDYTRESGVRILERQFSALCRKTARMIAAGERKSLSIRAGQLAPYLGAPKYKESRLYPRDEVGLVRGLAWTQVGGEVLDVECAVMPGSGKLELTGNLGDVMKESARAAVSYIRTRCGVLGIDPEFYKSKDIHLHFPEGAVPKDGPSAGITICIALISALTGLPVRRDVAMTGEISIRGRILPIGGLKEKTMAALRTGIHTVIIPSENEKDLEEIDQTVRSALNFVTTDHVDKILDTVLIRTAVPEEPMQRIPVADPAERGTRTIRQ